MCFKFYINGIIILHIILKIALSQHRVLRSIRADLCKSNSLIVTSACLLSDADHNLCTLLLRIVFHDYDQRAQRTFLNMSPCTRTEEFLCSCRLEVEILGHNVYTSSALLSIVKSFSKVVAPIHTPTNKLYNSSFFTGSDEAY